MSHQLTVLIHVRYDELNKFLIFSNKCIGLITEYLKCQVVFTQHQYLYKYIMTRIVKNQTTL